MRLPKSQQAVTFDLAIASKVVFVACYVFATVGLLYLALDEIDRANSE